MIGLDKLEMKIDEVLCVEFQVFKQEYCDLDEVIEVFIECGISDVLMIKCLKKKKLFLKDKIVYIEDCLILDIIVQRLYLSIVCVLLIIGGING